MTDPVLNLYGFTAVYPNTQWERPLWFWPPAAPLRPLCWSALPWSVPHVFDITVTRLPSLSWEIGECQRLERRNEQLPNI